MVLLIIALFVGAGYGVYALQGENEQFTAEALVVLQDPDAEDGGASSRFIIEQVEIMGSPIVAGAAATQIADEYQLEISADELLAKTNITSSNDSTLVTLSAIDGDSERAIAMVNGLAHGYEEVSTRQTTQTSAAALERIDAQVVALEDRLNEVSQGIQAEQDASVELRRLEDQFREALTLIADLQAELPDANDEQQEEIRAELDDLQLRVDNYQRALAASRDSAQLQALLVEQTQLIERRTELTQRRDQISIDTELAPGAVALLQPAVDTDSFTDSSPVRVLAVSFALGVGAAVAAAYFIELRRRRLGGRLEPRAILGVPLLADVPSFSDENLLSPLPVRDAPGSAAAEGFRFAAASISEAMRSKGAKSVMLVSSTVGHGKSTCIVNTSMADARRGHSVLLIDCDFGTQDAARLMLGTEGVNRAGLVDIVEDGIDLERGVTNLALGDQAALSLMGQGTRPMTANLLLGAESAGVFEQATETYDAVFIDGPPLLQMAYASTLANLVDALVVVVSHGTPVGELEDLVSRLQLIDTPILGYLYNRSPLRREMTRREGSMRDIYQEEGKPSGSRRLFWQKAGR